MTVNIWNIGCRKIPHLVMNISCHCMKK